MSKRASLLAERIELGAAGLAAFAQGLNDAEWQAVVPGDGRTVGVTVHHVANMYPIEVQLAQTLASGKPIEGVTAGDCSPQSFTPRPNRRGAKTPPAIRVGVVPARKGSSQEKEPRDSRPGALLTANGLSE